MEEMGALGGSDKVLEVDYERGLGNEGDSVGRMLADVGVVAC